MADLTARLKLEIDKSSAEGIMGQVSKDVSGAGKGKMGGLGALTGGIPKMLGLLGIIAGGITLLVKSSGMLQGVLKAVGKMIMFALRPLGDMLGVALMPILSVLRPIGRFFNMLMRPYIRKAMAAMRAGGLLMREGKEAEAMGAFGLGLQILLKPFADLTIKINAELLAGFSDLLSNIPFVGEAFKGLGDTIRSGAQAFIDTSTNVLDVQLGNLLANTEAITGKSMGNVVMMLKDTEVLTSFISKGMKLGITGPLSNAYTWMASRWGPDFVGTFKDVFNSLKTVMREQATPSSFGQPLRMPGSFNAAAGRAITLSSVESAISGSQRISDINVFVNAPMEGTIRMDDSQLRDAMDRMLSETYSELRAKLGG